MILIIYKKILDYNDYDSYNSNINYIIEHIGNLTEDRVLSTNFNMDYYKNTLSKKIDFLDNQFAHEINNVIKFLQNHFLYYKKEIKIMLNLKKV